MAVTLIWLASLVVAAALGFVAGMIFGVTLEDDEEDEG